MAVGFQELSAQVYGDTVLVALFQDLYPGDFVLCKELMVQLKVLILRNTVHDAAVIALDSALCECLCNIAEEDLILCDQYDTADICCNAVAEIRERIAVDVEFSRFAHVIRCQLIKSGRQLTFCGIAGDILFLIIYDQILILIDDFGRLSKRRILSVDFEHITLDEFFLGFDRSGVQSAAVFQEFCGLLSVRP